MLLRVELVREDRLSRRYDRARLDADAIKTVGAFGY